MKYKIYYKEYPIRISLTDTYLVLINKQLYEFSSLHHATDFIDWNINSVHNFKFEA